MFVTFEGPEGAGKSTAIATVAHQLQSDGVMTLSTREPGATDLGKCIRSLLLEAGPIDKKAELFLFLADRADHVTNTIRPALAEGLVVLCDRYMDSTMAYQGHARGMSLDRLRELNDFATGGLEPDLTLLFDLEPEVGLARITNKDRLDSESLEFHEKVREGFLAERNRDSNRFIIVRADLPAEDVARLCLEAIRARLQS